MASVSDTGGRGSARRRLGRLVLALAVLAAEPLDAARGVEQALLAREERVAVGADFDVVVLARRRSRLVGGAAAGAQDRHRDVLGVDAALHRVLLWGVAADFCRAPS